MKGEKCTLACWAMPDCHRCKLRKAPFGRSIPLEASTGYCHCEGYYEPPKPGHYWPEEERELRLQVRQRLMLS